MTIRIRNVTPQPNEGAKQSDRFASHSSPAES
jgi:hypothetical protein